MKYYVSLFFIASVLTVNSQYKKVKDYEIDGKKIALGQEFTIGPPSGIDGKYVHIMVKGNLGSPPIPISAGFEDGTFEIEQIRILKKPVGGLDGANIIFNKRFMILLKQALEAEEVILN